MDINIFLILIFLIIIYKYKNKFSNIYIKEIEIYHKYYQVITLLVILQLITFSQSIFTIITSSIFGLKLGYIYSLTAVIITSNISFFLSRYLINNTIKNIIQKYDYPNKIIKYQKNFSDNEWYKLSFLSRFSPIPFGINNLLWGITEIKYYKYLITTLLGSIIFVGFEAFIGHNIKNITNYKEKSSIYISILTIVFIVILLYYINNILTDIFNREIIEEE
tara:strand:- start:38 stop:697 length:660 start_codon:yes stop_codon:yes gene_type:complete